MRSSVKKRIKEPETPAFIDFKGELLIVSAEAPLPPGSRVAFSLPINDGNPVPVQGKVMSAVPMTDDPVKYRITLRIHSLTREDRERLIAATGTVGR